MRKFCYNDFKKIKNVKGEERKNALRALRNTLLKAWDIHKGNAYYGIDEHTEDQKAICVKWYKAVCDLEEWAFEYDQIPNCVKKYLKGY